MNISRIKTVKRGFVIFLAIIAMILFSNLPNAIAGDYIGEVCWSAYNTEDESGPANVGPFLLRSGVTYMGDSYFLLQGTVKMPDGSVEILNGSAVIVGNEVFLNGNFSWDNSSGQRRAGGIVQVRLAISTLNGTHWSIVNYFDTSDHNFGSSYKAGTMTLTTCP